LDHKDLNDPSTVKPPRGRQAWTIAKIELRRAFFSKRAFWVYGLALFPALIFFGHGIQLKLRRERFASRSITASSLLDSPQKGENIDNIRKRLGKPVEDFGWQTRRRVRAQGENTGITTHSIEPAVEARYVRLNITRPTYSGEPMARIREVEVYGPAGGETWRWDDSRPAAFPPSRPRVRRRPSTAM
jgi:hypothetical protein